MLPLQYWGQKKKKKVLAFIPVTSALGKQKQEECHEFKVNLAYRVRRERRDMRAGGWRYRHKRS